MSPEARPAGSSRSRNYERGMEDYVQVAERLQKFYAKYPDGSVVTTDVDFHVEEYVYVTVRSDNGTKEVPALKGWVLVKALAYRTPNDPVPGAGWSMLIMPGSTPYTRGSELENCETSAWGRALAAVGIESRESIASAAEIRQKMEEEAEPVTVSITSSNQPVAERGGYTPNATSTQITTVGSLAREVEMDNLKLWRLLVQTMPDLDAKPFPVDADEKEQTRFIKLALKESPATKVGEVIVVLMALKASGGALEEEEDGLPDIPEPS